MRLLSDYVRIDTSNPPGDTRKAADFLAADPGARGHPGHAVRIGAGEGDHLRASESHGVAAGRQGDSADAPHGRGAGGPIAMEDQSVRTDHPGQRTVGPWRDGHEGAGRRAAARVPAPEARPGPVDARRHSAGRTGRGSGRRARRAVDDRESLCRTGPGVRPRRRRLRQPRSVCARQARLRHLRRRKEDRLAEAPSGRRGGTWQPAERSESQRSPRQGAGATPGRVARRSEVPNRRRASRPCSK